jgi:hypothetical protein
MLKAVADTQADIIGLHGSSDDAELARRAVDPSGEFLHVTRDPMSGVWLLKRTKEPNISAALARVARSTIH